MKNKYYTPDIKEFRVGFEYNILETQPKNYYDTPMTYEDKWATKKWNDGEIRIGKLRYRIYNKEIRVKYLDQQDIEDCGFKLNSEDSEHFDFLLFNTDMTDIRGEQLGLLYNPISHWLMIYSGVYCITIRSENDSVHSSSNTLFAGYVKNKSQLQDLLLMLNIK